MAKPTDKFEKRLKKAAQAVANAIRECKGGTYREAKRESLYKLHVWDQEIHSAHESARTLEEFKAETRNLQDTAQALLQAMEAGLHQREEARREAEETNSELEAYAQKLLEKQAGARCNKSLRDSAPRTVRNKVATLRTTAQKALAFSRLYGLEVESLLLRDVGTADVSQIHLTQQASSVLRSTRLSDVPGTSAFYSSADVAPGPSGAGPNAPSRLKRLDSLAREQVSDGDDVSRFSRLAPAEQEKVFELLFLLDKYCASEDFYHELTMTVVGQDLPRSYIVKQSKSDLNKLFHIKPVAGDFCGAVESFDSLLVEEIRDYVQNEKMALPEKIKVKISGDGAPMSRDTSFTMLHFSLLNSGKRVLKPDGVKTFACLKGKENYATLRDGLAQVWEEVNGRIDAKRVEVDGKVYPLEFVFCADMKFEQLVYGLAGATANYACVHCTVHKNDRFRTDKPGQPRTLEDLMADGRQFSQKHLPLLHIPIDHIITDELHLLLRTGDVLIKNVVYEMVEWDKVAALSPGHRKGAHLRALIDSFRECGVSFSVWESREEGKELEFTSLVGDTMKKVLQRMPDKLEAILHPESAKQVANLWRAFWYLYQQLSSWEGCDGTTFQGHAKSWLHAFLALRGLRQGYQKERVTPYMHALCCHVPWQIRQYKSIKPFTCQPIEKRNCFARMAFQRKSNRSSPGKAASDVLAMTKRLYLLAPLERQHQKYKPRCSDRHRVSGLNLTEWQEEWVELDSTGDIDHDQVEPSLNDHLEPSAVASSSLCRVAPLTSPSRCSQASSAGDHLEPSAVASSSLSLVAPLTSPSPCSQASSAGDHLEPSPVASSSLSHSISPSPCSSSVAGASTLPIPVSRSSLPLAVSTLPKSQKRTSTSLPEKEPLVKRRIVHEIITEGQVESLKRTEVIQQLRARGMAAPSKASLQELKSSLKNVLSFPIL